ncbi:uncharacterized protein LOC142350986 [Convolutriloba macropyga]|uniref:uncharacterized protein LOC142350986 n=1 Tax=Convolutriloba macropyga TaxID=536237 RepID=UPI003F51EB1C
MTPPLAAIDVNECEEIEGSCGGSSDCENKEGSFLCLCDYGLEYNGADCQSIVTVTNLTYYQYNGSWNEIVVNITIRGLQHLKTLQMELKEQFTDVTIRHEVFVQSGAQEYPDHVTIVVYDACSGCFYVTKVVLDSQFGESIYNHPDIVGIPPATPEVILFADNIEDAKLFWRGDQTDVHLQNQVFYITIQPESDNCTTNEACQSVLKDKYFNFKTGNEFGFYAINVFAQSNFDSLTLWSDFKEITFINGFMNITAGPKICKGHFNVSFGSMYADFLKLYTVTDEKLLGQWVESTLLSQNETFIPSLQFEKASQQLWMSIGLVGFDNYGLYQLVELQSDNIDEIIYCGTALVNFNGEYVYTSSVAVYFYADEDVRCAEEELILDNNFEDSQRFCFVLDCRQLFCASKTLDNGTPFMNLGTSSSNGPLRSSNVTHEVYIPGYQFLSTYKGQIKNVYFEQINKGVARQRAANEEELQRHASKTSWWRA